MSGTWFSDIHPANIQSFLAPYQDLMWWPLISGAPAPVATAVIVAIEISIFIPAGHDRTVAELGEGARAADVVDVCAILGRRLLAARLGALPDKSC